MFGLFESKEKKVYKIERRIMKAAIMETGRGPGRESILRGLSEMHSIDPGAVREATDRVILTLQLAATEEKKMFLIECCRAWAAQDPSGRSDIFV